MPAPIIDGVITFVSQQLDIDIWDGEFPRTNTSQQPISPTSPVVVPATWPVIRGRMSEGGMTRTWTFTDAYDDRGDITIQVFATARDQLEDPSTGLLNQIEKLLSQATNWAAILLPGGESSNPYYVIQMLFIRWYVGQEEGVRTSQSGLLYRGEITYDVMVHGASPTN